VRGLCTTAGPGARRIFWVVVIAKTYLAEAFLGKQRRLDAHGSRELVTLCDAHRPPNCLVFARSSSDETKTIVVVQNGRASEARQTQLKSNNIVTAGIARFHEN